MGEVIEAHFGTTLDIPSERILRGATDANLESVVIVGWTDDGNLYFASSSGDRGAVLLLLENAKRVVLE